MRAINLRRYRAPRSGVSGDEAPLQTSEPSPPTDANQPPPTKKVKIQTSLDGPASRTRSRTFRSEEEDTVVLDEDAVMHLVEEAAKVKFLIARLKYNGL